ncbi:MAG TPA: hypothetical protein VHC73_11935 [Vitreimonas sp.]|nr:hypothetical protein [Vitreimonas sp.]
MRFALIATSAAAMVAIPLVAGAGAPRMSSAEFVSAVRCTAYQDAAHPDADVSLAKFRLNSEATRQSPEAAAEAHKAASEIARAAAAAENTGGLAQRACQGIAAASLAQLQRDA